MIDLHAHSTFSDGSLTPAELAAEGKRLGLTALALTDHDCVNGVPVFLEAARGAAMEGIGGVEISAEVKHGTMHVLGYYVNPENAPLAEALRRLREGRQTRNARILERLAALGMRLAEEEARAFAGEEVVGRLHIAMALEARGYVRSKDEAFERYLAKGRPAYADRLRLSPAECIRLVRGAGGVAALAHPFTLELGEADLETAVAELKGLGLEGLEVYYPEHGREQESFYGLLARRLGLLATGGSDFHGAGNPAIRLGRGFGSLCVPDELVGLLKERALQRKKQP